MTMREPALRDSSFMTLASRANLRSARKKRDVARKNLISGLNYGSSGSDSFAREEREPAVPRVDAAAIGGSSAPTVLWTTKCSKWDRDRMLGHEGGLAD